MEPKFHYPLLVQCDWRIHRHLCGITIKKTSKLKPFFAFCVQLWAFFEHILCRMCDSLALLGWSPKEKVWNLRKFIWVLNSWGAVFHKFFRTLFWTRSSLTTVGQPTTSLFIVNERLFDHLWTFYTTVN
jgi:hypothetical protein